MQHIYYPWRPNLRDPKDDHILELAVLASVGIIITYNKRDFAGVDKFGIALFTPREFLRRSKTCRQSKLRGI
jgi:predicted nucleic acid-binding protein